MADQLLEQVREVFEGQIDFEGQKLAEYLTTGLLTAIGALAFFVGFVLQDIRRALYIGVGGTVLTFALVVPPWPYLNRRPVKWLPVAGQEIPTEGIVVDGKIVA